MPADLHVHTTASDGAFSPSEVVHAAAAAGLSALAITDHDTVEGIDEAIHATGDTGVTVIPGVELSVDEESTSGGVHVLGLLIDHRNAPLVSALAALRHERDVRAHAMVRMLGDAGHAIDFASVAAIAGKGSIGRVHIARALVAARSVLTIEDAFRLLIGREGPFYVSKRTMSAAQAVSVIHAAGGVAVLAHPGVSGEASIPALCEAGLDGIEAFHAEHSPADSERFAALAERCGLLVTGGSDFHAPDVRSAPIGGGACPEGAVEALGMRATLYRP
jgi:predicted metal-dependent phosphoesterase TrpH